MTEMTGDGDELEAGSTASDHIAARKKAGEHRPEADLEGEEFCGSGVLSCCGSHCCTAAGSQTTAGTVPQ